MTRLYVWAALCLSATACSVSATDPGTVLQTAAAAKSMYISHYAVAQWSEG